MQVQPIPCGEVWAASRHAMANHYELTAPSFGRQPFAILTKAEYSFQLVKPSRGAQSLMPMA